MDHERALRAYDEQIRRSTTPPYAGFTIEQAGPVLRMVGPPEASWGCVVLATDLDEDNADQVITAQVDYYRGLGRPFEWKWHGYDTPGDLPARLRAAGLEPDEQEALVVGEVDGIVTALGDVQVPDDVVLRHLRDGPNVPAEQTDADYAAMVRQHSAVYDGADYNWLASDIRAERDAAPELLFIHLAEVAGEVVSSAWVRFHEGTEFASLWGGATLIPWRRKGIYRALVARRAREAQERGYRYLQVDASDDSLPILQRLGLYKLTDTTPYQGT